MGNWLVTILALIVLVAVLDGVRRAIIRHRSGMKISRKLSRAMRRHGNDDMDILSGEREAGEHSDPEEEARRRQVAAELPGQVRVVQRRALEEALRVNRHVQEDCISARKPRGDRAARGTAPGGDEPQQVSLNLEEQVPTLMESVAGDKERSEPELNESESLQALDDMPKTEPVQVKQSEKRPREKATEPRENSPVEEVLVINVMAPQGDCFEGNDLLRVMVATGMRYGEMDIFHHHQGGAADGPVVFSLANMVVPGVFDLAQMEEFTTPGVSLFLALPIEGSVIEALEQLLSTSQQIAELLGGELKDENRSVFTAQTAEHYRQRVMEYQRRKALARAKA